MKTLEKRRPAPGGVPSPPGTGRARMTRRSEEIDRLERRVGRVHLGQRLGIQTDHAARSHGVGLNFFHFENVRFLHTLAAVLLKGAGLFARGERNMLDLAIRRNDVFFPRLPEPFDRFRILHLSDLHLDTHPDLARVLIDRLDRIAGEYDVCVLTGDIRSSTHGSSEDAIRDLAAIRPHIGSPVYAVLGNHDFIETTPRLEEMGISLLLNESAEIRKDGESIFLAGVDDPHFYVADNIEKASSRIDADAFAILLAHSPEVYRKAAYCGFDFLLAGHTHGGQICLPGGAPILKNARCPRRLIAGPWRYRGLVGYTSTGSGASCLGVRYNCPPEITLHSLRRNRAADRSPGE